ncbi:DUF2845 domain-containing protein [Geomonas nitrogeniifigens]|uniref:DUF2845 domain-containing protein n=1 Tax=Geomonas diazotrophica TaxID=2843197 RepID=A0ABX8JEA9_9BACT|nr:DUF2845 domain-containing protein [Geomonas nitrogeniifigens]QWV96103.1 DUF2845 domain-containing protein [Geomonas nitrogeniifigens]
MRQKRKSQSPQNAIGVLMSVLILLAAVQLVKTDLTSFIFGAAKEPAIPMQQVPAMPAQPVAMPATQPQEPTDTSGYEHYTDKNGNEVVVVPARYEAEPAPIQAAPQQTLPQRSPLPSQQISPTTVAPIQAAPPRNVVLVAMNAANANTRMNVFESCRCNNGIATKGDTMGEVLEKCAQPAIKSGGRDCSQIWLYNFGPNEFMQGVCFNGGRVSKVLSLDYGY